jgi:hypothetical protein
VEKTIMTGPHRSVVARALTTFCADHRDLDLGRPIRTGGDPDRASRDSITGSPGCWRVLLWHDLQNAGFTSIDLVGTLPPHGCGLPTSS